MNPDKRAAAVWLRPYLDDMSERAKTGLCLLALLAACAVFFVALEFRSPLFFAYDDNASFFLPGYIHNWESLVVGGELPLINMHQYLGLPHLTQGQSAVLYPPAYLGMLVSVLATGGPYWTVDVLAIMHLTLAVLGTFLLLLRFGCRRLSGLFGALVFASFPFLMLSRSWIIVAYAAAVLPFAFLALDALIRRPGVGRALALAAANALLFYQGNFQYLLMLLLFETLYLAYALSGVSLSRWRRLHLNPVVRGFALSVLLLVAMCLPLLLPMMSASSASADRSGPLKPRLVVEHSLEAGAFLKAQFLSFEPNYFRNLGTDVFHMGLPMLALVFVGLFLRPSGIDSVPGRARQMALLTLIALLLSSGAYRLLALVQPFGMFRAPFKHYLFAAFFAALTAAIVLDRLAVSRRRGLALAVLFVLTAVVTLNLALSVAVRPITGYRLGSEPSLDLGPAGSGAGRLLTLWLEDVPDSDMHRFVPMNFATAFGLYHFAGYDPLVPRVNSELSLGLNNDLFWDGAIDGRLMGRLNAAGVRWLVASSGERIRNLAESRPEIELVHDDGLVTVAENRAAHPVAYAGNDPKNALPYRYLTNGLEIDVSDRAAGPVTVSLVPLPGFSYLFGDERQGRVQSGQFPVRIDVPDGVDRVTVMYSEPGLKTGLLLSLLLLCGFAAPAATKRFATWKSENTKG